MEIAKFLFDVGLAVTKFVFEAINSGNGAAVLDVKLGDILPAELKTTHARMVAEQNALRKFANHGDRDEHDARTARGEDDTKRVTVDGRK